MATYKYRHALSPKVKNLKSEGIVWYALARDKEDTVWPGGMKDLRTAPSLKSLMSAGSLLMRVSMKYVRLTTDKGQLPSAYQLLCTGCQLRCTGYQLL